MHVVPDIETWWPEPRIAELIGHPGVGDIVDGLPGTVRVFPKRSRTARREPGAIMVVSV